MRRLLQDREAAPKTTTERAPAGGDAIAAAGCPASEDEGTGGDRTLATGSRERAKSQQTLRRLRRGDTVALVTPAGPVEPQRLEAAVAVLESWGLAVKRFDNHQPALRYLADSDAGRAEQFQEAWTNPSVAAVIAARGGYGTQRMLDLLDWPALRAAGPKIFAGSSDVTALHQAIAAQLGLVTLFSAMPAGTFWDDTAAENLRRALFEPDTTLVLRGGETLVPGTAQGTITGGNLSLLASSVGTPEHRPPHEAIVLLEDVGEDVYRLDRMLTQLLRSGWFEGVTGIALGSWTKCGDPAQVRALMLDRLGPLGVPILWALPFGHLPGALTVPLGVEAVLDTEAGTLTTTV